MPFKFFESKRKPISFKFMDSENEICKGRAAPNPDVTLLDLQLLSPDPCYEVSGFDKFTNVTTVSCFRNVLTEIPSCIISMVQLKSLSLSRNRIDMLDPALSLLTNLEELRVCYNQLERIPNISSLCRLTLLQCDNNRLQTLTNSGVASLTNLENLNLAYNRLKFIDDISLLNRLTYLDVSENPMRSLEECGLEQATQLKQLRILQLQARGVVEAVLSLTKACPFVNVKWFGPNGFRCRDAARQLAEQLQHNDSVARFTFPPLIKQRIVDICLPMYPLDLPPYVLLEIINYLEFMELVDHKEKIDAIIAVRESCRRVDKARINKNTMVASSTSQSPEKHKHKKKTKQKKQ